jgi:uncharacterized protein (TIGR02145 family)
MKVLILFLLLSQSLLSQVWQRPFRQSEDLQWGQHLYKVIEFGQKDEWDNIQWTKWMLNDLVYTPTDNVLDLETQKGLSGVGHFVNGTIDSIYFNPEASQKVCPTGWRLPRIGEWDTLVSNLNWQQKISFFNKLPGYIGYSNLTINDTIIIKDIIKLNGGFYWSSTEAGEKIWGVEIEPSYNFQKGKADRWDFASVRCVEDENEE